jgi:hypothetical protein
MTGLLVAVLVVSVASLSGYARARVSALLFIATAGLLLLGALVRARFGDIALVAIVITCFGWGYGRAFTIDRGKLSGQRGALGPLSFRRVLGLVGMHLIAAVLVAYSQPRYQFLSLGLMLFGAAIFIAHLLHLRLDRGGVAPTSPG